jgi:hypothetical protein
MPAPRPSLNAPINAPAMENFQSSINKGLMKSAKFLVVFGTPRVMFDDRLSPFRTIDSMRNLSYLCEAAEFAGRSLQTYDVRYYGPSMKMPFLSVYNDLAVTLLCTSNMREKRFFDYWHNKVNSNATYDFAYRDDYSTTMSIFAFDETGIATYKQNFTHTYPLIVNPIQTAWQDDQVARLNVIFTYKHYETIDDPPKVPRLQTLVQGSVSEEIGSFFLGETNDRR